MALQEDAMDPFEFLLDTFYNLGALLVEDDIHDFPWDPMKGGPGHTYGGIHHGMIGYFIQTAAFVGRLAKVAVELQSELGNKSEIQSIIERYERIAYPTY